MEETPALLTARPLDRAAQAQSFAREHPHDRLAGDAQRALHDRMAALLQESRLENRLNDEQLRKTRGMMVRACQRMREPAARSPSLLLAAIAFLATESADLSEFLRKYRSLLWPSLFAAVETGARGAAPREVPPHVGDELAVDVLRYVRTLQELQ